MRTFIKAVCLPFFLFHLASGKAQNGDCNKLLNVSDSIYISGEIHGYGDALEYSGNDGLNKMAFEKESNSIWYLMRMPGSGAFTFDILPDGTNDDWDFLLYEHKKMFCKRIVDGKIVPIRTNLSRSGKTGISASGNDDFVGAGVNNNYSNSLQVTEGEKYILVVNNPKRSGRRHTLHLHYPSTKKEIKMVPPPPKIEDENSVELTVSLLERNTGTPIKGYMEVLEKDKRLFLKEMVSKHTSGLANRVARLSLYAGAKGYMPVYKRIKVGNKPRVSSEVFLEKIETGKKVNLEKIRFHGNSADFLSESMPMLESIVLFMQQNPAVKIKLEGHVNGPNKKNSKEFIALSSKRAEAVKLFLERKGIAMDRVFFEGYGNSKMIFPSPKSERQMAANRRVEMLILEK